MKNGNQSSPSKHDPPQKRSSSGEQDHQRSLPRRLAEWVSLAISVLLILTTATFLVIEGFRGESELVPVEIRVLQTSNRNGKRIVTVEVRNLGEQTVRNLTGEVMVTPPGGQEGSHEFTIDYLGVNSRQEVYLFVDSSSPDPRITAQPLTYQLE